MLQSLNVPPVTKALATLACLLALILVCRYSFERSDVQSAIKRASMHPILQGNFSMSSALARTGSSWSTFTQNLRKAPQHSVCIMTRIRSVDKRTTCRAVEWARYHFLLGVDHIYITDDCSTEQHFQKVLEGMPNVTYIPGTNCSNHVPNENLLFKTMFTNYRDSCDWIAVIDMDEFINFRENVTETSIGAILANYPHPFMHLAWWVIGSDGHYLSPPGFIIENYHHGKLQENHLKTIGRSSRIGMWSFSLFPFAIEPKEKTFVETQYLRSDEMEQQDGRMVPTRPLFVKHYVYLSYEDFMAVRAKRTVTSNNDTNNWAVKPQETWVSSILTAPPYAANFTSKMATLLRTSFHENPVPHTHGCTTLWEL